MISGLTGGMEGVQSAHGQITEFLVVGDKLAEGITLHLALAHNPSRGAAIVWQAWFGRLPATGVGIKMEGKKIKRPH